MAIKTKIIETIRHKDLSGTYDVTLEEVSRKRVFPEDEVIEIIAEAIETVKRQMEIMGEYHSRTYSPYREIAHRAIKSIKERFQISILPKDAIDSYLKQKEA